MGQQTNLKKYRLSLEELAMADLVSCGWDKGEAYSVTVQTGYNTWTKSAINSRIREITNSEGFIQRIEDITRLRKKKQVDEVTPDNRKDERELLKKATSKEQMLLDLQTALEASQAGTKEWLDIKKMIIDVTRMKQDEVKEEDCTIHYYLPVSYPTSCEDCLLKTVRKKLESGQV